MEKIKELIDKYNTKSKHECYPLDEKFEKGEQVGISNTCLEITHDLKQLKQSLQQSKPAPVVVPEFVGAWLEYVKEYGSLADALTPNDIKGSSMAEWLYGETENYRILVNAWLDGYTVEKEPLYYVIFAKYAGDWKYTYLERDGYVEHTDELSYLVPFTEKQIKQIDERHWSYAVPVEEVEK